MRAALDKNKTMVYSDNCLRAEQKALIGCHQGVSPISPLNHLAVLKWLNLAKHRQKLCEYTYILCSFFLV